MTSSLRGTRCGLVAGLLCFLPVLLWLGGGLQVGPGQPGPTPGLLVTALRALWLGQALLALLLPRDLDSGANTRMQPARANLLAASSMLAFVPAPLWISIAATGLVPTLGLLVGLCASTLFVIAMPQLLLAWDRALAAHVATPHRHLGRRGLEIALALGLLWLATDWKGW